MHRLRAAADSHLLRRLRPISAASYSSSSSRPFQLGRMIGALSHPQLVPAAAAPPRHHGLEFRRSLILQSDPEIVKIERLSGSDSGIVELKLQRYENRNSISWELIRRLRVAIKAIGEDSSVNVAVVSSTVPKVFCAGADLKERRAMSSAEVQKYAFTLRSTMTSLAALPMPSIAVIEGAALGGGLELALSCDLRICGEEAILGMPETGHAIIPGAGGTQRLPRTVGIPIAKELILTGQRINGKQALTIGLINHCVPVGEAYAKALQIAREINQKGPLAIRMAKQAINRGAEVDISSGLAVEGECYDQLLETKDRLEGLDAFVEKRKPTYSGK